MPIISAFFGIVIRMYYKEHEPAHFHAEHSGQKATFDFNGELIAGSIRSRRARAEFARGRNVITLNSRRIGRK